MFCVCTAIPLPKIHYQIFLLKRHYRKENDIRDACQTALARAGRRESEQVGVFARRGDVKAGEKRFCEAARREAEASNGRLARRDVNVWLNDSHSLFNGSFGKGKAKDKFGY